MVQKCSSDGDGSGCLFHGNVGEKTGPNVELIEVPQSRGSIRFQAQIVWLDAELCCCVVRQ